MGTRLDGAGGASAVMTDIGLCSKSGGEQDTVTLFSAAFH